MTRNLKALGLALIAVFAMSAVVASAAQAEITLTAFDTPSETHTAAELVGEQSTSHVFTATGGFAGISCTTATFNGSTSGTEATPSAAPHYTGCTDTLGRTAHVSVNGCSYTFHATETVEGEDTWVGSADLVCPENQQIVVTVTRTGTHCTVTIPPQNGIAPIYFQNMTNASPTDITINSEATNITSETHGGFLACGTSTTHHTEGTYEGNTTVKAFDENGQIDLELSD